MTRSRISQKLNRIKKHRLNMTAIIALGFIAVILIGTILLSLPISSQSRTWTNPLTSAFTSVSATCVTGLIVVDSGMYWSAFGQAVILLMIQVGGLGFMTVAVLAALLFGKAVTPRDRMLVAMSYNLNSYDSVTELVRRIALGTALFEGGGALLLMTRFVPEFGAKGIWMSIFASVSAFCNAGFDIQGQTEFASLIAYADDPVVNFTIMFLIIMGGIGFLVWSDAVSLVRRKRKRLSVYTKMVLIITAILIVGGTALIAMFEWNNSATIGDMPWYQKIMASMFQSVSLRTAGFATVDNGYLTQGSLLVSIIWMFIGGASGSTAGGVKVVTVGVLIYTVFCVARGKREITLFNRRISRDSFTRAVAVFIVQLMLIIVGTAIILMTTDSSLTKVMFEAVSAVDTVGLTTGITPHLGSLARVVLMLLMYFGRVGLLTVAYAMAASLSSTKESSMRYPDANVLIG